MQWIWLIAEQQQQTMVILLQAKKKIWNILSKVFTRLCKGKRTLDISVYDCISLFIMMRGVRACVCV